jgi:predicted RNA-binding protein with RPS1 domain
MLTCYRPDKENPMKTDWTLVKLSQETREKLEAVRDSMLVAEEMRMRTLDRDNRDRVSLDQIIRLLIEFREGHARRVRESKARRRGKRQTESEAVGLPQDVIVNDR